LAGLEDSSRNWSVAMTLEHLIIVGEQMAVVQACLAHDEAPPVEVSTAAVKPQGVLGDDAPDVYEAFSQQYLAETDTMPRRSTATLAHPWFGPLDVHGWGVLASLHQSIHRRQIAAILRGL
jgi:hypothetical protein